MFKTLLVAASLAILPAAHAQNKHVHGEGRLDVVIEGGKISIGLELPLDAAVGFERAPKSDKEKAALAATVRALNDAALYVPTPAASCTLQSRTVQVPFAGGEDKHDRHAHEGETHHADIEATHVYACANPAALKGFETTIFQSLKRLYRLEVQRSGPVGQGAARLTPKKPVLAW